MTDPKSKPRVTDADREQYYMRILESVKFMSENFPQGFEGTLVACAVGLGRISESPVSISDIANMTGFSRQKVLRVVAILEQAGWVEVEQTPGRTLVQSCWGRPRDAEHQDLLDRLVQSREKLDALIERSNHFACRHWSRCTARNRDWRVCARCDQEDPRQP